MKRRRSALRTVVLYGASLLIFAAYPLPVPHVYAEDTPAATSPASTETAPVATATSPAAASAEQPAPASEPVKPTYTYDSATGHWNTDQWQYSGATGTYEPVVVAPLPAALTPSAETTATPSTGPTSSDTPSLQTAVDATTNATVENNLTSQSATGNAGVVHNTTGGNATTGTASATGTITNMLNSTVSGGLGAPATFTANITGDVVGDLVLNPMITSALLQAASTPATDTTIQGVSTADITNNLTLGATSGDATVAGNTTAGNATSGDANAVANIINVINSAIAAGSSFIGTINIYGNLNGDILVSPDFIPQLLGTGGAQSLDANLTNNQSIINNVKLAATTGTAAVEGNTHAGSATSGTAATNLVLLNLTGHDIVAKDSLLVFVNVLGHWVGLIVDAAPGATSAVIGNGVASDTATNTTIHATNNAAITNNVDLSAASGNATVAHNTSAGNATTGNATASANIANISQSQLSLSGWFGVLFINVFGNWMGSFGVDTAAGAQPIVGGAPLTTPGLTVTPAATGEKVATPQPFAFVPHRTGNTAMTPLVGGSSSSAPTAPAAPSAALASHTAPASKAVATPASTTPAAATVTPVDSPLPIAPAITILGILGLVGAAFRRLHLAMSLS